MFTHTQESHKNPTLEPLICTLQHGSFPSEILWRKLLFHWLSVADRICVGVGICAHFSSQLQDTVWADPVHAATLSVRSMCQPCCVQTALSPRCPPSSLTLTLFLPSLPQNSLMEGFNGDTSLSCLLLSLCLSCPRDCGRPFCPKTNKISNQLVTISISES